MKEFEGVLSHNPQIRNLDAVVGFLRASGYFSLRPFLNSIKSVRVLIGIDVDKYIAETARQGKLFFGAEDDVKQDYSNLKNEINTNKTETGCGCLIMIFIVLIIYWLLS